MTGTMQIEAGRELDALVAVEVMGMERVAEWAQGYGFDDYSATGDGMLAVLERMRGMGWSISATWEVPQGELDDAHSWMVMFRRSRYVRTSFADALPHAVCLAALEAVRA